MLLLADEDINLVSSMSSAIILSDTARIALARSEYPLDDRWTLSWPVHSGAPLLAVLSLKAETDNPSVDMEIVFCRPDVQQLDMTINSFLNF